MDRIAAIFDVHKSTVSRAVRGKSWPHVPQRPGTDIRQNNLPRGVGHRSAKLKDEDIPVIRRMKLEGMGYASIADVFDVRPFTIKCVCLGRTWKHVPSAASLEAA